jgi:hypothetical protein
MKVLDNDMILFLKNMNKNSSKIEKKLLLHIKIVENETKNMVTMNYKNIYYKS